jgi:hypothetical protein
VKLFRLLTSHLLACALTHTHAQSCHNRISESESAPLESIMVSKGVRQ